MLAPGIHYPSKNAIRQLIKSLPGASVYPKDNNLFPYTTKPVIYSNFNKNLVPGDEVIVKLNGVVIGTPTVLDAAGNYALEFTAPLGTFALESVFPDTTSQTQYFRSVNLYTLVGVLGDEYRDYKVQSLQASAGLYSTFYTSGIFRSQGDELAYNSWGGMTGFIRPFDWTFEKYSDVLGGNAVAGVPGFLPTFVRGSTTGAVKDVVESVTGYRPTDADFRGLQQTRWQLSRDGWKYRYVPGITPGTGAPADTGAAGPHYFLRAAGNVLATPVAVLESDVRKAFTMLLHVEHDGFFVENGEVITKSTISNIDKLQYTWLNPWAYNPLVNHQTGFNTFEAWVLAGDVAPKTWVIPGAAPVQYKVYLNGSQVAYSDFLIAGNTLTLGAGITIAVDDYVQVEYLTVGPTRWHDAFVFSGPTVFTLSSPPIPTDMDVFVNGKRLETTLGEYSFITPDQIGILVDLDIGDNIDVVYIDSGAEPRYEISQVYSAITPPVFSAPDSIVQGSVNVYVNGIKAPIGMYSIHINGVTVSINYAGLGVVTGDRITVVCTYVHRDGYNVHIVQGTTIYSQGYHFHVNYRTGEVIWDVTKPNPTDGLGYMAYYIYFPKDILDFMIGTIKPATMRVFLEFETTIPTTQVFRPYFWDGMKNATGNVIL